MRKLFVIAAGVLGVAGLTLGSSSSLGQDLCDHGGNHLIQVSEGANGEPELSYRGGSAEYVRVCVGDSVQWVLTGSDRDFLIEFSSIAAFGDASFRGSSNGVVQLTIGEHFQPDTYAYGVQFKGGQPMDPHIIVER